MSNNYNDFYNGENDWYDDKSDINESEDAKGKSYVNSPGDGDYSEGDSDFADGSFKDYTDSITPEVRYNEIFNSENPGNRALSVSSMIVGIVSVLFCCLWFVSLAASAMALVFSIVSRKKLGYFDGYALTGLILGVFGMVLGISSLVSFIFNITDLLSFIPF